MASTESFITLLTCFLTPRNRITSELSKCSERVSDIFRCLLPTTSQCRDTQNSGKMFLHPQDGIASPSRIILPKTCPIFWVKIFNQLTTRYSYTGCVTLE